jgi:polysaccharide biosynthesis transport protein
MNVSRPHNHSINAVHLEAAEKTGIDIMRLVLKVLHRPHFIVPFVVAGILAACGMLEILAPRYSSSAQILIDPRSPGSFGAESAFASLYVDSARIESVLTVLQSANLLDQVIDAQHLTDDPEFADNGPSAFGTLLQNLHMLRSVSSAPDTLQARKMRALARLVHALKVTRVGMTYVLDVSVAASTPTKAQRLAQSVADSYINDQMHSKAEAAQRDYNWLASRLIEAQQAIRASEEAVVAVRRKFALAVVDPDSESKTDQEAVQDLNRQLLAADGEVASLRAKYEQMAEALKGNGDIGVLLTSINSPITDELARERNALVQKLDDLSAHYTAAYAPFKEAKQDKVSLDRLIRAEATRQVESFRSAYETADAKRQALAAALAHQTTEAGSAAKSEGYLELRDAERVAAANRTLYQTLLGKSQEVEQQLARHDPEARIISPAIEPGSASFPKPVMIVGGGAFLGMICGVGLALVAPSREKGFVINKDVETRLSLPVLGVLPDLSRGSRHAPVDIIPYVVSRPFSQYTECLRALRTSLRVGSADGPRLIQLTSATPGEGKSTISAALAVTAALSGIRTALVDLDIRNPSVADLFAMENPVGVTDILEGGMPGSDARHMHRNLPLTIIPAGTISCPAPDIIASRQLREFIDSIRDDYELVILDSPPVLAVSDPLAICTIADATLLVIESEGTPKPIVEQAVKALRAAQAPLVGAVFNKTDPSDAGGHPYGYGAHKAYRPTPRKLTSVGEGRYRNDIV